MYCSNANDSTLTVIANNDYCFNVELLTEKDEPYIAEEDTVEMTIHGYGDDRVLKATCIKDNIASFYFDKDFTKSLLQKGLGCSYRYCIRITFSNGSCCTPIYRQVLNVMRC